MPQLVMQEGLRTFNEFKEARTKVEEIKRQLYRNNRLSLTNFYKLCEENEWIESLKNLYSVMQHSRIEKVFFKRLMVEGFIRNQLDPEELTEFADRYMENPIYLPRLINILGYDFPFYAKVNENLCSYFYYTGEAVTSFTNNEELKLCMRTVKRYQYGRDTGGRDQINPHLIVRSENSRIRLTDTHYLGGFMWT